MAETQLIATVCAVFALAGLVKGVLGFGLPMVSLGILTIVLDVTSAITILILPALVTNFWQAVAGGKAMLLWRRLWLFFGMAIITIALGTAALMYNRLSSVMLGSIVIVYSITSLMGARYALAPHREKTAATVFGAINGLLTGMTGSFVFPGVLFMQGIGLSRDELIQAMGILFTLSTIVLAAVMFARGLLVMPLGAMSLIAIAPALLGMSGGRLIRRHLSEARFRQIFYSGLCVLGLYIVIKNLFLSP